jgi:hypothetical protein
MPKRCRFPCEMSYRKAELASSHLGLHIPTEDTESCGVWQERLEEIFHFPPAYRIIKVYGVGRDAVVFKAIFENDDGESDILAIRLAPTCMDEKSFDAYMRVHEYLVDKGLSIPILYKDLRPIPDDSLFPHAEECDNNLRNYMFLISTGCEGDYRSFMKGSLEERQKTGQDLLDLLNRTSELGFLMADFRLPNVMRCPSGAMYHIDTEESIRIPPELRERAKVHSGLLFFFSASYMNLVNEDTWPIFEPIFNEVFVRQQRDFSTVLRRTLYWMRGNGRGTRLAYRSPRVIAGFEDAYAHTVRLFDKYGHEVPVEDLNQLLTFYQKYLL